MVSSRFKYITYILLLHSDRVALLAGSAGVDSSSGSTGGASFPRPKGLWQVTQKQKTVDDLVNEILLRYSTFELPQHLITFLQLKFVLLSA